jgi:hypothetical protein
MLLPLAAALAAAPAHTPEEEAAKKAADAAYGKEVPWAAVCLSEVVAGDAPPARLVGIRRRETGCEPFGVMVGTTWAPIATALPVVLGEEKWKGLPPAKRDEVLRAWVDDAWLAFAAPTGAGSVAHAGGRTQVTREALRRDGEVGRAADVRTVYTFDAAGALVDRPETVVRRWKTALFVQQLVVTSMPDGVAQAGVESSGGAIQQCWTDAWEQDRALSGHTRLQWLVAKGAAGSVTEVEASTLPAPVVTCIGNALQRSTWPADVDGAARYLFGVDRREAP